MICVFQALPLQNGPTTTFSPFAQKASSAATEVTNTIIWLTLN